MSHWMAKCLNGTTWRKKMMKSVSWVTFMAVDATFICETFHGRREGNYFDIFQRQVGHLRPLIVGIITETLNSDACIFGVKFRLKAASFCRRTSSDWLDLRPQFHGIFSPAVIIFFLQVLIHWGWTGFRPEFTQFVAWILLFSPDN